MSDTGEFQELVLDRVTEILYTSRKMLTAADEGNWDLLARLENLRGLMIEECFSIPETGSAVSSLTACIHEIIQLNNNILELGNSRLSKLTEQLNACKQQRQIRLVYSQSNTEYR